MKNLIEELYYGNLDLASMRPELNSEYSKKHREINALLRKADSQLSLTDVMQLENTIVSLEEIVGRSYFTIGFQWGAKLILSIFDYEPDMFAFEDD